MKSKRLLLMLLIALIAPWAANAQTLGDYTFSTGNDATKWKTVTSTTTYLVSGGDSQASTLQNIGFTFPFGEETYTQFSFNTDGNLRLGSTATSTSGYSSPFGTNISSNCPKINAFGCDGYATANHYVKYQTFDDNLLVVEFCMGTYTSSTRNELYLWQIQLHSNGDIEIVFPDASGIPATAPAVAHQCGMCVNSSDGWIITLSDNVATHFTSSTTTTNASGTWFDANRYYTFTRPVISCPKPTLTDVNASTDYASLRWTENGSATSWRVEYSTSSDFSANVQSKTFQNMPAGSITDLNSGTTYYARVIAMCEPGVDESFPSNVLSFNTECDILYVTEQNPYEQNFDGVTGTTSGTTNNLPLCWNYINETSYSSYAGYPVVYNGSSYAHSGNNYLRLYSYYYNSSYTDYDPQDQYAILPEMQGVNSLRMKLYARAYSTSSSYSTYDATFHVGVMTNPADATTFTEVATYTPTTTTYELYTIPFSSYTGTGHYIAIMIEAAETGSSTFYRTVCIDDIVVEPIPSCVEPDTPEYVAGSADTESAKVTWTPNGNETSWDLYWSASETAPTATTTPTAEGVTMTDNEYTINGLTANNTYYVWVRAHCSATSQSPWSGPCSFTTPCDAITITDSWSENFNSLTAGIPNCWDNSEGTTTTEYLKWNYYATGHDGACLRFDSYSNSSDNTNFLKTPTLNFATGKVMQLRFWYKNPTGGDFSVYISTDGGNTYTTSLATGLTGASSWTQQEITLTNYVDAQNVVIVFKGTSNWGNGDAYIYLDDVAIVEAPSCLKPTELAVTANSITYDGAVITWTAGASETQWQIEFSKNSDFSNPLYETVQGEPTYTFHGLDESTTYYVHVQAVCGGSNGSSEYSTPVSFSTLQTPTNLPYTTDFESGNDWLLVNGDLTNAWAYGTANNNGGTHAIYISNDGGTTNAYDNNSTMVYATKLFNFEAGIYVFSYDWIANGESSWDYLRVALVPSSVQLTAGTSAPSVSSGSFYNNLPTGWIALDGGGKLNLQQEWQSFATNEMEIAAGTYMMVFAWRNDGSTNNNPPAAIDNVSIAKITCTTPADLEAPQSGITATSAQLSWTETGEATAWEIELTDEEDHVTTIPVDEEDLVEGVYTIRDLSPETVYSVRVRANCGDGYSNWSEEEIFETAEDCQMSDGLAAVAYTNSAVISWNGYGQEEFNLRYGTDGETWTTEPRVTNNYTLADLTPATTYYVQVQPTCADAETWSVEYSFTTECVAQTITATEPFTEGFEGITGTHVYSETNGIVPTCWDSYSEGSVYPHMINSGSYYYHHNGTGTMYFKGEANTNSYLALPLFTNDLSTLMVSFWMATESSSNGTLSLGYITDADVDYNSYQVIKTYNNTTTNTSMVQCQTFVGSNTIPSNATRLVFRWQYTGTSWYGACIDDVTVEIAPTFTKHIDAYDVENERGWYLIASPLAEETDPTDVENLIPANASNYALYRFNQNAELEWENYKAHTDDFVLEHGRGYLYANSTEGGVDLTFIGTPYSDNGEVTLHKTAGAQFEGMNLVGNPFPDTAYIDRPFYTMKQDGTGIMTDKISGAIGPMEGIFVEANEEGETLIFTTQAPAGSKGLVLNLSQGRGIVDRAIVRFGEGHTLHKFMLNESSTKMYIPQEGEDFAVVRSRNAGEVTVNFEPAEDGIYSLSVDAENLVVRSLILTDKVERVDIDMLRTPTYQFKASTTDPADRFVLSYKTGTNQFKELFMANEKSSDFGIFNNGSWMIDNEGEATLQVIDMNGRVLSSETINGNASIHVDAAPGVYMLRLINGETVKVQKVVVE